MPVLTDSEVSTIANALRAAADVYVADRDTYRKVAGDIPGDTESGAIKRAGHLRVAEQFERQAIEARELAGRLEQAESVRLA
jgi:hypothetical protein